MENRATLETFRLQKFFELLSLNCVTIVDNTEPTSDHVAKFHRDRHKEFGDRVLKRDISSET